jgi:hypothetical protein
MAGERLRVGRGVVAAGDGFTRYPRYPSGADMGKILDMHASWRVGKGWHHGYAGGRVNVLPTLTRPTAIPKHEKGNIN